MSRSFLDLGYPLHSGKPICCWFSCSVRPARSGQCPALRVGPAHKAALWRRSKKVEVHPNLRPVANRPSYSVRIGRRNRPGGDTACCGTWAYYVRFPLDFSVYSCIIVSNRESGRRIKARLGLCGRKNAGWGATQQHPKRTTPCRAADGGGADGGSDHQNERLKAVKMNEKRS